MRKISRLKYQYEVVKALIHDVETRDLEDLNDWRQFVSECSRLRVYNNSVDHFKSLVKFIKKERDFGKRPKEAKATQTKLLATNCDCDFWLQPETQKDSSCSRLASALAMEIFNQSLKKSGKKTVAEDKSGIQDSHLESEIEIKEEMIE